MSEQALKELQEVRKQMWDDFHARIVNKVKTAVWNAINKVHEEEDWIDKYTPFVVKDVVKSLTVWCSEKFKEQGVTCPELCSFTLEYRNDYKSNEEYSIRWSPVDDCAGSPVFFADENSARTMAFTLRALGFENVKHIDEFRIKASTGEILEIK